MGVRYRILFGLISVVILLSGCVEEPPELTKDVSPEEPQEESVVKVTLLAELDDRCNLKPETGPCKALFERYYFDQEGRICKQFVWGGCEGTVPFESLEECRETCEK